MISIKLIYRALLDRRRANRPVTVERRHRLRAREAENSLRLSIERLSNAIKMKRPDIMERGSAVVTFVTFSEICNYRTPMLNVRRCRHPSHRGQDDAECNERLCPFMNGAA